ncbi:MAG: C2H2-type zinc finger protein [Nitrososphaerota archaeon]|nr:C2H2-type zinc finger protein [Nitrososphaerota archaeon]
MPEFRCDACGVNFPAQEALMQHNAAAHAQPHQHFACRACGAEFHSQAELQVHSRSAHPM